jgi:hypothetical protein
MAAVGGALLLLAHIVGAAADAGQKGSFEWVAMFAHGAAGSTAAVLFVDFYAVPSGRRCLEVALVAGLLAGLAYGAATWVGLRAGKHFIWARGPFVTAATIVYLTSILFSLFLARLDEEQIRLALGKLPNDHS